MLYKTFFCLFMCWTNLYTSPDGSALEAKRGLKEIAGVIQDGAHQTLSQVTQSMHGIQTELHDLKHVIQELPQKTTEEFHLAPARVALVALGSASAGWGLKRLLELTTPEKIISLDRFQTGFNSFLISAGLFFILKARAIVNFYN